MTVHRVAQRTPAWYALKLAQLGASDAGKALGIRKSDKQPTSESEELVLSLACERVTGQRAEGDDLRNNQDVARGVRCEPLAVGAYEALTGTLVDTSVGWMQHDELPTGCSPDGLLPDGGLIEIKAPRGPRHLETMRAKQVPGHYLTQLTHQLWVSGAPYVDFVSYGETMPDALRVCVVRLHRDDVDLAAHDVAVRAFLARVDATVESLLALGAA